MIGHGMEENCTIKMQMITSHRTTIIGTPHNPSTLQLPVCTAYLISNRNGVHITCTPVPVFADQVFYFTITHLFSIFPFISITTL